MSELIQRSHTFLESREKQSSEPGCIWVGLDTRLPSTSFRLPIDLTSRDARLIGLLSTSLHASQIVLDLLDLFALFTPFSNDLLLCLAYGLLDLLTLSHHLHVALAHHDLTGARVGATLS